MALEKGRHNKYLKTGNLRCEICFKCKIWVGWAMYLLVGVVVMEVDCLS